MVLKLYLPGIVFSGRFGWLGGRLLQAAGPHQRGAHQAASVGARGGGDLPTPPDADQVEHVLVRPGQARPSAFFVRLRQGNLSVIEESGHSC
jgi:hypothetical protein